MSLPVIEKSDLELFESLDLKIEDVIPYDEDNDPSRRAHYINPPMNLHIWKPGMTTKEIVDIARLTGDYVVALCGYQWVPKHDPDKYDLCDQCSKIAQEMLSENGG